MGEVTQNPYESPSLATSEEAAAPPTRFNARERRAIERFLWLNQVIAGCVITMGVVMPAAFFIGFASGVSQISVVELVEFSAIMVAVVVVGIFQAGKNIYAITTTGAAATLILFWFLFLVVLAFFPVSIFSVYFLATLPCLGPLTALFFWPPIWTMIMAWHWRLRGVDLQALTNVRYTDVGNSSNHLVDSTVDQTPGSS